MALQTTSEGGGRGGLNLKAFQHQAAPTVSPIRIKIRQITRPCLAFRQKLDASENIRV